MFKALIVALAAVAVAIPTHPQSSNNINQCANGAEVRCCNKEAIKNYRNTLTLEALDGVLSPVCSKLDVVPIVSDIASNQGGCDQQTVCCNNVEQNGVVNVACTPVDVL